MSKTFYQFYNYDVEVIVGSLVITTALRRGEFGLCDKLIINRQENTAGNATFSFIPPEEIIDLEAYQGEAVLILFRTPTDGWQQVFTGFVDVPSLDFINRKITFACTDDRNNQIIQLPYSIVRSIGYFDEAVFGTPTDQSDELDRRLQTVAGNFDFNRFGQPTLTSWAPKGTPDFVLDSGDVRQGTNPKVSFASRKTTINTVTVSFKYSYQRLHQQNISFVWPGFSGLIQDWFLAGKPSFPQRNHIQSAASSGEWQLIRISFTPLWEAGGYSGPNGVLIWQPDQVINSYAPKTKFTGYLMTNSVPPIPVVVGNPPTKVPQYEPVVDADGNKVMEIVAMTITNTSSALCTGAQWTSAKKFSQTVSETYNVTIAAPQSVAKYGVINSNSNYSIADEYDVNIWETGSVVSDVTDNFFIDQDYGRANLSSALAAAYHRAVHDIRAVHRDIQVQFQTLGIRSKIDLVHTIDFNVSDPKSTTSHISAIGKVSAISHTIDFRTEQAYTDVTLSLSKAEGEDSNDPFGYEIPQQNPGYIGVPQRINLSTHSGIDPASTSLSDKWIGWICNKEITRSTGSAITVARTNFTESFVVDYPKIPDSLRNEVKYIADTELAIAIPDDFLETST